MDSLRGRHILILGGSDGIGYATAEFLLRAGSIVTVSARNEEKLASAVARLRQSAGVTQSQIRTKRADAVDPALVEAAVQHACDARGNLQGVLVVAGSGNFKPVLENDTASVTDDLTSNVLPLVYALNSAAPLLGPNGGSVVAVSSISGVQSSRGLSSYGAGKAGLDQYVRVAADELGPRNIRINAIQPGLVKTGATKFVFGNAALVNKFVERTPLGRYGKPEDLAAVLAFFLSAEAGWITGQCLAVDGGLTLRGYPDLGI